MPLLLGRHISKVLGGSGGVGVPSHSVEAREPATRLPGDWESGVSQVVSEVENEAVSDVDLSDNSRSLSVSCDETLRAQRRKRSWETRCGDCIVIHALGGWRCSRSTSNRATDGYLAPIRG